MSNSCQNITALMKSDNAETEVRKFFRIRCKQWTCPYCAKILKRQWQAVIFKSIPLLGENWSFTTLTMPDYCHTKNYEHNANLSAKKIKEQWNLFATRLRQAKGKFEYIRVLETHEDDAIHIHLLANIHFDDLKPVNEGKPNEYWRSDLIKTLTDACEFGYVSHTVNLPPEDYSRAVGYVTKYMTKCDYSLNDALKSSKIRRIQTSRGIKFNTLDKDSKDDWQRIPHVSIYDAEFWYLFDLDRGKVLELSDFEDKQFYPPDLVRSPK